MIWGPCQILTGLRDTESNGCAHGPFLLRKNEPYPIPLGRSLTRDGKNESTFADTLTAGIKRLDRHPAVRNWTLMWEICFATRPRLRRSPSGAARCPAAGASPSWRWAVRPTGAASWICWARTGSSSG